MSTSESPYLHEQIKAEAAAEAQRQAQIEATRNGLQQRSAQGSSQPGVRDAVIDQRAVQAGLVERPQMQDEVGNAIADANLQPAVIQRESSQTRP